MITVGWPLRGGRGKKIQKYQKNNKKKKYVVSYPDVANTAVLNVAFTWADFKRGDTYPGIRFLT